MTSATYRVTGMTCAHCVRAVSGELKALDGVRDVTVDHVPGDASAVTVTSDGPLARQAVADASARPATTRSPGAKQAARRPSRAAGSSLWPGVISGPFGLKVFIPNGPGCT